MSQNYTPEFKKKIVRDKAAIQYYILARGKSAKKTGDVEIPGHSKDVSEYVGRPALSLQSLMLVLEYN